MIDSQEVVYKYTFPLDYDDGVAEPISKPEVNGQLYLYHYDLQHGELVIIQEEPDTRLHSSETDVDVMIHSKKAIEEANDAGTLVEEFTNVQVSPGPSSLRS